MLESSGFRKYSTLLVIQLFSTCLCLCHCLCIRLCLCICVPYSFLNSYYHKLSENVCVWGSGAYFYRIEFQARGAPHVHMLCWCKDSNLMSYPNLMDTKHEDYPAKLLEIAACHSKLIRTEIGDDLSDDVRVMVEVSNTQLYILLP